MQLGAGGLLSDLPISKRKLLKNVLLLFDFITEKTAFFSSKESTRKELIISCFSCSYLLLLVLGFNTLKEVKGNIFFKTYKLENGELSKLMAKSSKLLLHSSPYQKFVVVPAIFLPILVFLWSLWKSKCC